MNRINLKLGNFIYDTEIVKGSEIKSFLGIPYAESERFGMPRLINDYAQDPVNTGKGMRFPQSNVPVLLNFFMKNPMMRPEILTDTDVTSDNAFHLNIWTQSTEGKRPVLVFIHGGGLTYGSGTTPLYSGKYLAAKGIVAVTINYRLGAPGFIPVKIDGALSVNRGFYDQQCAIRWVRENIALFGGDENNITLMGQSAGGLSASTHMMSEESCKYFDKLIVMSAGNNRSLTMEQADKIADNFLKNNNIKNWVSFYKMPWKKLIRLKMPLMLLTSPYIDGLLLKKSAYEILANAEFAYKPVMLGTTGDEMEMINNKSWYKGLGIVTKEEVFNRKCKDFYGEIGSKMAAEFKKEGFSITGIQFKMHELPFHSTVLKELKEYSKKNPVYGYRMNFVPNVWGGLRGAYHCAELPFVFGTIEDTDYKPSGENLRQTEILQKDWVEFIKTGEISGREKFSENGRIILYEGARTEMIGFPMRELLEEAQKTDLLDRIQSAFMKGRDDNFIA